MSNWSSSQAITVAWPAFPSEGSQTDPIYIGTDPVSYYGTVAGSQSGNFPISYYEVILSSTSLATFTITISQMVRNANLYLYTASGSNLFGTLQDYSTNSGTTMDSVSWTGSGNSVLYIVVGADFEGTSFLLTAIQN